MIKVMNSGLFWPFLAMMTTAYVLGTWSANIMFEWSVLIEMAVLWAIVFALWGIMAYLVYKYDVWLEKRKDRKKEKKNAFLESLKQKAEEGDAHIQFLLSFVYTEGVEAPKNKKKSFHWMKASAEQGYTHAFGEISRMYAEGLGIKKDQKQAFHWMKKSAETGCKISCKHLGMMYHVGEATPQDNKKALEWLKKGEAHITKRFLRSLICVVNNDVVHKTPKGA